MNKRKIKKAIKRIKYLPRNKYFFYYLFNKVKYYYLKATKSTKVAYPSTIMIELTNHCNLACTICPREYEYGIEMDKGMMDTTKAKEIIDELHPYLDSIGLTGMGETFMYNDLPEIVDYIKDKNKGIIISISTNAVLPSFVKKVKRVIGKIDTIQVSIDGLNEVYDSIRINSSFDVLETNLEILAKLCKDTSTDLMLNMVVTKENYKHMPDLVEYADKIGINYLDFSMFNLAAVTDIPLEYYDFYQSQEFLKLEAELNNAIQKTKSVLVTEKNFKTNDGFKNCPFPWTHFYVSQDSYVPPCCAKPFPKEKSFGSVQNQPLMNVLNNSDYKEWREMWFRNETPDFCKNCNFTIQKTIEIA